MPGASRFSRNAPYWSGKLVGIAPGPTKTPPASPGRFRMQAYRTQSWADPFASPLQVPNIAGYIQDQLPSSCSRPEWPLDPLHIPGISRFSRNPLYWSRKSVKVAPGPTRTPRRLQVDPECKHIAPKVSQNSLWAPGTFQASPHPVGMQAYLKTFRVRQTRS